jgi:hypothetical protein
MSNRIDIAQINSYTIMGAELSLARGNYQNCDIIIHLCASKILYQIAGVPDFVNTHEVFLDAPRTNKPIIETDTPCLVIGPAGPRSTERLLAHDSACTFLIIIYVTRCIAQLVGRGNQGRTGGGEAVLTS